MLTTNQKFSKLGLSFAAALLLSSAGGSVAHASPLPTSSDEARLLAGEVVTLHATGMAAPITGAISSTDEARSLAGSSFPISSINATSSTIVTSTDEARTVGGPRPVPIGIERPVGSHAVASTAERN